MLAASIISATLLQPIGDTVWWRTEGAEVTQQSDQKVCSLFVFQPAKAVGFLWDKKAFAGVVFFNDKWDFRPSETQAAVRIGDRWISENSDVDWFRATEEKNALMVPIRFYPVESLLRNAGSVSLRHEDADLDLLFDKRKMPQLLDAVDNCRRHLA